VTEPWKKKRAKAIRHARLMKRDPNLRERLYGAGATTRTQEAPDTRETAKDLKPDG
jgi:hypothetical protein